MTYSWFQTFAMFWMLCSFLVGLSPGVCILCADISEHSVSSIFIGGVSMKMELIVCSEMSAHKMQTLGINQKKEYIWHYYILKFTVMVFHSLMLNPCLLKEKVLLYETREVSSISFSRSHFMIVECWWHGIHWPASYFGCVLPTSCWKFSCMYVCVSYFLIRRLYLYLPVVVALI